jgi:hypothetical protein
MIAVARPVDDSAARGDISHSRARPGTSIMPLYRFRMDAFLAASRATEPFKQAVVSYSNGARDVERICVEGRAPRDKVLRVLKQMLATEPQLDIDRVRLRGESGCSDFVGVIEVRTAAGVRRYEFVWDCRWRAEQEGWSDYFGFPDQIRAAQELDWQCFAKWEARAVATETAHSIERSPAPAL